jgi:release factor glutamine methyltransferase
MTIRQAITFLSERLAPVALDLAQREAEEILERLLNVDRSLLYASGKSQISDLTLKSMENIITKRLTGIPLAYVLGNKFFHSVDLMVTPDVLIPRPDTEILIETILSSEKSARAYFVDVGTGSGAIAAALLFNRPAWNGIATDISFRAAQIARKNLPKTFPVIISDMLSAFKNLPLFDFIACNPPYISSTEFPLLDSSVRQFEPSTALLGGFDGLYYYHILAKNASSFLKPNGSVYCEIGYNQQQQVQTIFKSNGWIDITVRTDLAGHPRVISARHTNA